MLEQNNKLLALRHSTFKISLTGGKKFKSQKKEMVKQ